jgi:ADP-heptose:LPS heptosyltransferase
MDSGNMHLASLAGIPVVSIWGATHPLGGFLGYGQSMENVVQRTDLDCRPCSIYGNKPCSFGDYRCLTGIAPKTVVENVERIARREKC